MRGEEVPVDWDENGNPSDGDVIHEELEDKE